jgi:tRNA(Ile)-lysidine synthase
MNLSSILERFFRESAPLADGDRIVVGFSGGPDSTALLAGLAQLARRRPLAILALHLDHGLDPGSAGRATAAGRLAGRLGVPFVAERWEVAALCRPGEGREAAGRRMRYERLAALRRETGARYVATAHHRDDQAETVLLRLLFGSGLSGLAGIRPVDGFLLRPLLAVPRSALVAALAAAGLQAVDDPTNRDLKPVRNRLRHQVLPRLVAADPGLPERLARLAARAAGARRRIEATVDEVLAPRTGPAGTSISRQSISRQAFAELPAPLRPFALALLHRRAGAPYPASAAAQTELLRQLTRAEEIGCDCGGGWRWEGGEGKDGGERFALIAPADRRTVGGGFTYTLQVPGVTIDERFRVGSADSAWIAEVTNDAA